MDRRHVAFAERHHGLVTRELLLATSITEGSIEHLLDSRRLRVVRPGVYRVVGAPVTWAQELMAVALSIDGAVVSHASAAALYGVSDVPDRHEVTTERDRRVRMAGVRAHRSLCWLPEDTTQRAGLPISSTARLVVDLSVRCAPSKLGSMIDALARRRLLRLTDLARTNGRLRAAPGRCPSVIDDLLKARWDGYSPGDSDLEARLIRVLQRHHVPAPTAQHRVKIGDKRYRIDLCYPDIKLAIEIDSWAYHRWRSAFDGDRAKRNDLTLIGYRVLQITDGMSDAEIVGTISRALTALGHYSGS